MTTKNIETNYQIDHANGTLTADVVLDRRYILHSKKIKKATTLLQHFKGWVIRTEKPEFDTDRFVMMDYNLKDPETTSFFYVLPYARDRALLEFTYFSENQVDDKVYKEYLQEYINKHLNIDNYTIEKIEKGVIPMTSYNFNQHNHGNHIKVGTAGGWVKPSTGYSFKLSEEKAKQLVINYKQNKKLTTNLFSKRHYVYDCTLLEVLKKYNAQGDKLFLQLYKRNPANRLLDFLDDRSTFIQELKIMKSMTSMRFVNGFFKTLKNGII